MEQLEATATWDPSIHDKDPSVHDDKNPSVYDNDIASGNTVYAILRVSVKLMHPPDIELVLRKRICFRIRKPGLLMKKFSYYTRTGVMYEVVTGAPKVSTLVSILLIIETTWLICISYIIMCNSCNMARVICLIYTPEVLFTRSLIPDG